MNRAERRKRERAGISVKKEPTLNLKVSAFNSMVSTATQQAKDRATAAAIHEIDQQILERDKAFSLVRVSRIEAQTVIYKIGVVGFHFATLLPALGLEMVLAVLVLTSSPSKYHLPQGAWCEAGLHLEAHW